MKKFFDKIFRRGKIAFDEVGILATKSDGKEIVVKWSNVKKIVLVDTFEEYSGYFLTEDYKSKVLYHNIYLACNQNVVRIRTGGSPKIRKNTSRPFSRKFGTTSIYYPIFVEYIDEFGRKNLYANHYDDEAKLETVKKLSEFLSKDKIHKKNKVEGFTTLSEI